MIATAGGEFLTTCYDSGTIGRISADGQDLPPYAHDKDGNPFVGPNDFAPDRHGGIYFTCSGTAPGPVIDGKIFYLAPDGTITQKAADVHSANGIVVSNDGATLYAIETEEHRLIQFKIGADASLSDRRVSGIGPPRPCTPSPPYSGSSATARNAAICTTWSNGPPCSPGRTAMSG